MAYEPHAVPARRKDGQSARRTVLALALAGGSGEFSWRTQEQKDFAEGQRTSFNIPATAEWQDVTVALPAQGSIIHVRLAFPGKVIPDLASIELKAAPTNAGK